MGKIALRKIAKYSDKRISIQNVSLENFVTIDNLLQNKMGLTKAISLPPQKGNMPCYCAENILIGNIRPYLKKIWFADRDGGCSADVLAIDVNKGFDTKFVYYALFRDDFFIHMMKGSKGTKMPRGDKFQIMDFLIPNFEFNHQQKIASVLSSLDAKIDLNNRINAELEAMAKTLYDYWFVQFDFPDENGKPYKSSGGAMEYNAELKREIPKGWKFKKLCEIANITLGQSPDGESYNDGQEGIVFYQGCTDFGIRYPTVRQYTTKPTRFAKSGDILLSVRAPVGSINLANEKCCIGRGLAALNSKNGTDTFLFGVMRNFKVVFERRNTNGTTFGSITKDDLYSLLVVIPEDNNIIQMYQSIINSSFEKQNMIERENQQLAELRDWLLPMLMNEQVKVMDNAVTANGQHG